jgi:hypothetical protein
MLIYLITSSLEKEVIRDEQRKVNSNNEGYAKI